MRANPWHKWFGRVEASTRRSSAGRARRTLLHLEQLEARCVPTFLTLASFNYANGADPSGRLLEDSSGNLFGTTFYGGPTNDGTVFEVASGSMAITNLANFTSNTIFTNGSHPNGYLIEDSSGTLFGTTAAGGIYADGTVFGLIQGSHTISSLASFDVNGVNGGYPNGGLVEDASGDLFGTTNAGSHASLADTYTVYGTGGAVFELQPGNNVPLTLAPLYTDTTGSNPSSGLIADSSGNLFGTTYIGGPGGAGAVYELLRGSSDPVILASSDGDFLVNPGLGPLLRDSSGDLFGTAEYGGTGYVGGQSGFGTIFEVVPGSGGITLALTLADFNGSNGALPSGGLVEDASGNLYGTTLYGGLYNDGTVFELKGGTIVTLYSFNGTHPSSGVIIDSSGNLFGTMEGSGDYGGVYELTAPTITTLNLPNWTVGKAYSQTLTATGGTGTLTFSTSAGALPNGLTLSSGGTLSGTPSAAGAFTFTVTATDTVGNSINKSYTVIINSAVTIPTTLPNGTVGSPYSQTISGAGGTGALTYSFTGILPPGLSLSSSSGLISGTPASAGTYSFTINATDNVGATGSKSYTVTIANPSNTTLSALGSGLQIFVVAGDTINLSTFIGSTSSGRLVVNDPTPGKLITDATGKFTISGAAGNETATENVNLAGDFTSITITGAGGGQTVNFNGGSFVGTSVNDGTIPTVHFGITLSSFSGNLAVQSSTALTVSAPILGLGTIAIASAGANTPLTVNANITSENEAVTLQATGALSVGLGVVVNSGLGRMSLSADVKATGGGDDGVGTLTINSAASVYGGVINLTGADVDIASTATVGSAVASWSLPTSPSATLTGLSGPLWSTYDGSGNIYVSNYSAGSGTTVSELAFGFPTAYSALSGLSGPVPLAFDKSGNLYVGNYTGNSVSKFAPGASTGSTFATGLSNPRALAFDSSGNLYVANQGGNTISVFAPNGNPLPSLMGVTNPYTLTFDSSGNLYVANAGSTVSKFAPGATTPNNPTLSGGLNNPDALAFDSSGNLYVANQGGSTVCKFAPGAVTPFAILTGLSTPTGLAFDGGGNLYVSNAGTGTVSKFAPGATMASATLMGLNQPYFLAFDGSGNLYVPNYGNGTVSEFTATNIAATSAVNIHSSLSFRLMSLGGNNNAAVAGVNLTSAELARIFTASTGTLNIGDSSQTGNITFTTATPATTPGAATVVYQAITGPGKIVLDDGSGSGTALVSSGMLSLTAGTGGIAALSANNNTPELSVGFATVTLNTAGPIGSSSNRIQFADVFNTNIQNVVIGTTIAPASVYLDGLGNLTLRTIKGGPATPIDVTARTNLVVASNGLIDSGSAALSLGADLTAAGTGDDGSGTLTLQAGAGVYGGTITLRGADEDIATTATVGSPIATSVFPAAASTSLQGFPFQGYGPLGLAFDQSGNLYVANYGGGTGSTVSKFAPAVSPYPVAILSGGLSGPVPLAFAPSGDLYVGNWIGNSVSKFALGATTGSTFATGLSNPRALAFDSSGNLYVANQGGTTVSRFAPNGTPLQPLTGLTNPYTLAFDSSGNLYVANFGGNTVSKFAAAVLSAPGSQGPTATLKGLIQPLNQPDALAFDSSGNLYVANYGGTTVSVFAPGSLYANPVPLGGVSAPSGLAFDASGDLLVTNSSANTVSEFLPGVPTPSTTLMGLNDPFALAFDQAGNLYVANYLGGYPLFGVISEFTATNLARTTAVNIRSSLPSRPMSIGGTNNAAVAGINLTSAELARIFTTSSGTVTFGDSSQTGNITFRTATPATTFGAATSAVQAGSGAGTIILDDGAGSGTALDGHGGTISLTAGTGGIVALSTTNSTAELATTGATVTLDTNGPIGSNTNRIQLADNSSLTQQVVVIGTKSQPTNVFVDGLGSLTVGTIKGGANTPIEVTARTNLVVPPNGSLNSGGAVLSLDADLTQAGTGTLTLWGSSSVNGNFIILRGANVDIATTATVGSIAATSQVQIHSSAPSRPMSIGGSNNAAVAGVSLTAAELARIFTTPNGAITFGDNLQTGNITFTTSTPATTPGAATFAIEAGASAIILDSAGSATPALNGNGGSVTLTAGSGGIVEKTTDLAGTADISNATTVSLTSTGSLGNGLGFLQLGATNLSTDTSSTGANQFLSALGLGGTVVIASLNAGSGTITLSGSGGGTFQDDGTIASPLMVDFVVLTGNGTTAAVTVINGILQPGDAPGILHTGNLTLGAASLFRAQIGGTTAGTGYSQDAVTGTVSLGGAHLDLQFLSGFATAPGQSFVLIANDGTDPVVGTFAGLPEGALILAGGQYFHITYAGGDGNDVALIVAYPPLRVNLTGPLNWTLNQPGYALTFSATGGSGPYTFSLSPDTTLAPGLSFSSDGVLSGTPTAVGFYYIRVTVTDSLGGAVTSPGFDVTINSPVTIGVTTLASFTGSNGARPEAGVIMDSSGNLFGTTLQGGTSDDGTVFELPRGSNTITPLASFSGSNGANPECAPALDSSGNLFGTTFSGGNPDGSGNGTVFEVQGGSNTVTTLARFNFTNGDRPQGNVVMDSSGNLFGTTSDGGAGYGTVFELPHGSSTITTVAAFNGTNGDIPVGGVIRDGSGNLFGVTEFGGPTFSGPATGNGTIFEVKQGSSAVTTLASFTGGDNGSLPEAGLVEDGTGNLFGTTAGSGGSNLATVFELPKGSTTVSTLAAFNGYNGADPRGSLVVDSSGNLFGTTYVGGVDAAHPYGVVFELPHGSSSLIPLSYFNSSDGANPSGALVEDRSGNFVGTTEFGGTVNLGTVFDPALASATAGVSYNQTLVASGGTGTLTFTAAAGSLPSGLTLSNAGVLSGTPTTAGTFIIPVTATDSIGSSSTAAYVLIINPGPATQYLVSILGSSTVQAGSAFQITVQAADQYGNPVTSYSGPAMVTASISPTSSASSFPATVSLNSSGFGFVLANLQKVGAYTITAAAGPFTGSAAPVSVTPGPVVKLAFGAQPVNTPTGVVLPPVTVQLLDAYGNVVTSDNSDVVIVSVASGPVSFMAGSTTTATVSGGVATFANLKLVQPGSYTLGEQVHSLYTGPDSAAFAVTPLQVLPGSFAGTSSGFSLQFNAPFLVNSLTPVLYGQGFGVSAPVPSLTVAQTRDGSGNPVNNLVEGSLILNAASNSLTYVATNTAYETNTGSPILPDGTYKVILHSSAATDGFQALNSGGGFLDGLGSGVAGSGDFQTTFTINATAAGADVLWVPATANGPGQPLNAPGMNQANPGYPIYLNDSTGTVTDVQVTLNYSSALLMVTGASGGGFTLLATSTPGHALLHYSGPALPKGAATPIGYVLATVPAGTSGSPTPYRAKDLLHLSAALINGSTSNVVTSDGLHLVAYVGDSDGNGAYSSNDAVLITRTALQTDNGFVAYPLVDPVIVADTDGSGFIPADAGLQVNEVGVGFPASTLPNPPIPPGVHFQAIANNVDPTLSLGARRQGSGNSDGVVRVAVNLDDAHPEGSTGLIEAHLALTYDPRHFSVTAADVQSGSLLSAAWSVVPTINPVTGEIAIALSSTMPISSTAPGSLVTIDFHPAGRIDNPSYGIALVASVNPTGGEVVTTELEDAQGTFTLSFQNSVATSTSSAAPIVLRDDYVPTRLAPAAWQESTSEHLAAPLERQVSDILISEQASLPEEPGDLDPGLHGLPVVLRTFAIPDVSASTSVVWLSQAGACLAPALLQGFGTVEFFSVGQSLLQHLPGNLIRRQGDTELLNRVGWEDPFNYLEPISELPPPRAAAKQAALDLYFARSAEDNGWEELSADCTGADAGASQASEADSDIVWRTNWYGSG